MNHVWLHTRHFETQSNTSNAASKDATENVCIRMHQKKNDSATAKSNCAISQLGLCCVRCFLSVMDFLGVWESAINKPKNNDGLNNNSNEKQSDNHSDDAIMNDYKETVLETQQISSSIRKQDNSISNIKSNTKKSEQSVRSTNLSTAITSKVATICG